MRRIPQSFPVRGIRLKFPIVSALIVPDVAISCQDNQKSLWGRQYRGVLMSILINVSESGNCASFDDLYEQYHAAIARHVTRRLACDSDLVEDVCQEVWIAVWKALPETPQPTSTWLYRIATNMAINAWRKKYRVQPSRGKGPQALPLSLDAC